jgi:hypothetical protein
MKGLVPEGGGKARIDDIINQEIGHIAILSKKLMALA